MGQIDKIGLFDHKTDSDHNLLTNIKVIQYFLTREVN
ncbi:hypothetical protein VINE108274_07560 [Vibrio neptunius]